MRKQFMILDDLINYRGDLDKLKNELEPHPYDLCEGQQPGYQTRTARKKNYLIIQLFILKRVVKRKNYQ